MISASLLALFSTLISCGFCGKEFISLGRHTWRCKDKIDFNQTKQNEVPEVLKIQSYLFICYGSYLFIYIGNA